MPYKNPFKNPVFDDKMTTVKNSIKIYLNEKKFELKGLSYDELIQWHDVSLNGPRLIYPSEKCPEVIKNIVQEFINKEFIITE